MTNEATQFEVLNSQDHADLRVITDYRSSFGDAQMQVMVFPFEFRNIQACYPIFFQADANDQFYPVALLGFEEGEVYSEEFVAYFSGDVDGATTTATDGDISGLVGVCGTHCHRADHSGQVENGPADRIAAGRRRSRYCWSDLGQS